jgi:WD40 repeat protein
MPMILSGPVPCTECGTAVPPGAPGGQCPICLLQIASVAQDAGQGVAGMVLEGHELIEEVARGGMGIVYRANQLRLGREVAVKILRGGEFADAEARRRFRDEAAVASRLQHPGIVAIHDFGEHEGVLWFSMDLVCGENLGAHTREHPLPARDAARCALDVARAVEHAHAQGVLHRDLKPSNILLDAEGRTRVTDFGIARRFGPGATVSPGDATMPGQMLGSPGYAAPELALEGKADVRADVYGLGAVLYHLLTARPPFQGPTLDSILVQLRDSDPLPPRKLSAGIPRDLETVCLKALARDPRVRYASAGELAADLERFLDGRPVLARPAPAWERSARWMRRRPGTAALIGLVLTLVVALVSGALAFARRQARMEQRTALIAQSHAAREEGVAGSRTRSLAAIRAAWALGPSAELRANAVAALSLIEVTRENLKPPQDAPRGGGSADGSFVPQFEKGSLKVMRRDTGEVVARLEGFDAPPLAQLDDRGTRIALARAVAPKSVGEVTVHELPSGRILHTLQHPHPVRCLAWAGELIAVGGTEDRLVHVWDAESGRRLHRLSGHDGDIESLSFRPDGQELVSLARDSVLRVWHAARGVEVLRLEGLLAQAGPAWWEADGTRLCRSRADGSGTDVFRFEWPAGVRVLAPGSDEPRSENLPSLSLSDDGTFAAAIGEAGPRVWSLPKGRALAAFPKDGQEWATAVLSPRADGLWLSGWNRALRRVPMTGAASGWPVVGPEQHTGLDSGPLLVGRRADGAALVLTNNGEANEDFVRIYATATGDSVHLPQPDPFCAALSPDGRWAVTGSFAADGAWVWRLPEGDHLKRLSHPGRVLGVSFLADGDTVWLWGDGGARRVRTRDWSPLEPLIPGPFAAFAPSPDGHWVAWVSGSVAVVREAAEGGKEWRLPVPGTVGRVGPSTLAFSADGRRLVLHTTLGVIVAWDLPEIFLAVERCGLKE